MAMRQERMLELLAEAERHRETLVGLRAALRDAIKQVDPAMLASEFGLMLGYLLDTYHVPNNSSMAVERYHFGKFKRHNEREKARATDRRRAAGVRPKLSTAEAETAIFTQQMAEADYGEAGSINEDDYKPTPEQEAEDEKLRLETERIQNSGRGGA